MAGGVGATPPGPKGKIDSAREGSPASACRTAISWTRRFAIDGSSDVQVVASVSAASGVGAASRRFQSGSTASAVVVSIRSGAR